MSLQLPVAWNTSSCAHSHGSRGINHLADAGVDQDLLAVVAGVHPPGAVELDEVDTPRQPAHHHAARIRGRVQLHDPAVPDVADVVGAGVVCDAPGLAEAAAGDACGRAPAR